MHQFTVREKTGFVVLTVYSRTVRLMADIQKAYPASEGYTVGHKVDQRERDFEFKMAA